MDPGNDIYPFHAALVHKGQAALNGWRTSLTVTNPTATDFADYLGTDQFPFVSTTPVIGTYVIRGNPSPTGTIAGTPVFGVPGAPSMPTVGLDLTRVPNRTAVALPSKAQFRVRRSSVACTRFLRRGSAIFETHRSSSERLSRRGSSSSGGRANSFDRVDAR